MKCSYCFSNSGVTYLAWYLVTGATNWHQEADVVIGPSPPTPCSAGADCDIITLCIFRKKNSCLLADEIFRKTVGESDCQDLSSIILQYHFLVVCLMFL